jgi:Zn-dependent protease with chaperone function
MPPVAHPDASPSVSRARDFDDFRSAQARHRLGARIRAIPALVAAGVMGIPISVFVSPLLLALVVVVTDVVNLLVPIPDVGARLIEILREFFLYQPAPLRAVTLLVTVWVLPGFVGLIVVYLLIRRRLETIGAAAIVSSLGARAPGRGADEMQLLNVVSEYSLAAGITRPEVRILRTRGANALAYGQDPNHATLVIEPRLLQTLDREAIQGVVARLIAASTDGDLVLATSVGAVYASYGLVTSLIASPFSARARERLRVAGRGMFGSGGVAPSANASEFVGLPVDDEFDENRARSWLTLLTLSSFVAAATSLVNLFFSGPLLFLAWHSRVLLSDAVAVDLTRNPAALARALRTLGDGRGLPGSGWLELLLVSGGAATPRYDRERGRTISDSSLAISISPSVAERVARLESMGAPRTDGEGSALAAPRISRRRRLLARRSMIGSGMLAAYYLGGAIATILVLIPIGLVAVFWLALVLFPIHDLLRGIAAN